MLSCLWITAAIALLSTFMSVGFFLLRAASKNGYSLDSIKRMVWDGIADKFHSLSKLPLSLTVGAAAVTMMAAGAIIFMKRPNLPVEAEEPPGPGTMEQLSLIHSVQALFPEHFLLSDNNGVLLELAKELLGGQAISADALDGGKERLKHFLEEWRYSKGGFSLPKGMKLPDGEKVYTFEKVYSVEESLAELRGVEERLQDRLDIHEEDPVKQWSLIDDCYHLAIRGMDALYFGHQDSRSMITSQETWMYAEYTLVGLVNGYIYDEHQPAKLLDMYYRTMQLFDYLGTIADTEELALEMYFAALICSRCAYDILIENDFYVEGSEYGDTIWSFHMELLYRVLLKVEKNQREGFFLLMKEGEDLFLAHASAEWEQDEGQSEDGKPLDGYDLYKNWRDSI